MLSLSSKVMADSELLHHPSHVVGHSMDVAGTWLQQHKAEEERVVQVGIYTRFESAEKIKFAFSL